MTLELSVAYDLHNEVVAMTIRPSGEGCRLDYTI